jgi:hypothetical protein
MYHLGEAILRREQSKQLLEIAKTGVERAIETDGATATHWINQQLTQLPSMEWQAFWVPCG